MQIEWYTYFLGINFQPTSTPPPKASPTNSHLFMIFILGFIIKNYFLDTSNDPAAPPITAPVTVL